MIQKVTIEPTEDYPTPQLYRVSADGNVIENCTDIDFSIAPGEYPEVTITLNSLLQFDGAADVIYDFTSTTFRETLEMMSYYLDAFHYKKERREEYGILLHALSDYMDGDEEKAKETLKRVGLAIEDILAGFDDE